MSVRVPSRAPRRRIRGNENDLFRYERALTRSGFSAIAGIDEAGRGACAGPLVIGATVLDPNSRPLLRALAELDDSKKLTSLARERVADQVKQYARSWATVAIPASEVDRIGLHVANIRGMRQALARLSIRPDYALTDGFAVSGLPVPNLGVWKGDQVSGCVSAAGVLAKVTRDHMMSELDGQWPEYGFAGHKGYVTSVHRERLAHFGPSPEHRLSFAPVRAAIGERLRSAYEESDQEGAA
ncbi:MAG: ribonuclease HII [Actinomycetes bacterium]|jgi:ribonuclease HII